MALVKATSEAIGLAQLGQGWGMNLEAQVFVDSSAALAVTARRGNGKLRHVKVGHLWVQELAANDEVMFRKVAGEWNPADLMTKHVAVGTRLRLLPLLGQREAAGRASAGISVDVLRQLPSDIAVCDVLGSRRSVGSYASNSRISARTCSCRV